MLRVWLFSGAALAAAALTPAKAEVLATCGASYGQARHEGEADWTADAITGGAFRFTLDAQGNPNVLFKDARGGVIDAAASGAEVYVAFADDLHAHIGFIVIYPDDGLIETYTIYALAGKRTLQWTSNKGNALLPPRVAAFTSACD